MDRTSLPVSQTIVTMVFFSLLSSMCIAAKYDLEHSVDGGMTFSIAGTIRGNKRMGDIEVDREPATKELLSALSNLVQRDGFYVLRVASGRSDHAGQPLYASTAVRASCLASSKTAPSERLGLHLSADSRTIVSLEYSLSSILPCKAMATPQLPSNSVVMLRNSVQGPSVIKVTQQGAPDNAFASMQAACEFLEEIDQDFSPGHLAINHTKRLFQDPVLTHFHHS